MGSRVEESREEKHRSEPLYKEDIKDIDTWVADYQNYDKTSAERSIPFD